MRKFDIRKLRIKKIDGSQLDERLILLNLLLSQLLVLIIALVIIFFQKTNSWSDMFSVEPGWSILVWSVIFTAAVLIANYVIDKAVPDHMTDDGGINQLLFGRRPVWQIISLSLMIAICEELLFRGAIQHAIGPYWTSIIFAVIHFRYLRHWLMTGLVFGISYGLGWMYVQTGTLWVPIAAHFMIDAVMGCIIRFRRHS